MSDKIRAQHLARKAMLYVRQSSAYQVSHNLESQMRIWAALQPARRHARVLNGWWQRSVLAALERLPLARFRDSRATVASGSNWSKFAGSSIPC
jgi:hypothetical protein